jgi:hypothetical protein
MGKSKDTAVSTDNLELDETPGETHGKTVARLRLNPIMRHATTANAMAAATVKFDGEAVAASDSSGVLSDIAEQVRSGDLGPISDYLIAQAVMLDSTTTELMRRSWQNAGQRPDAFRSYMALAMKAQAQSRATLEALARIHQPREQVVRHVHVNQGGQAVVADHVHLQGPGGENAGIAYQSDAQRAPVAALPSPDPLGSGVPIASGQGSEALPDARRDQPRRSARKPERAKARAENHGDKPASTIP